MRELSLHILDIIQNSIAAEASKIKLKVKDDIDNNKFSILISDNGYGIKADKIKEITDPFVTSRQTREVGLGLPLLKAAAVRCDGHLEIESKPGKGTKIEAFFKNDHIDRAPLGDIAGTLVSLIATNPDKNFVYYHFVNNKKFIFNTADIKEQLEGLEINQTSILNWIEEYINEGIEDLYGGD